MLGVRGFVPPHMQKFQGEIFDTAGLALRRFIFVSAGFLEYGGAMCAVLPQMPREGLHSGEKYLFRKS